MAQVVGAGGGHKRGASQRGGEPNTSPNSPAFPWLPPALSSGSSPQPPSPISPHFSPSPNFPSGHLGRAEQGWGPQGAEGMWGQRVFSDLREVGERWRERLPGKRKPPGRGGIQGSSGQVGGASLPPLPQLTRSAPSCHLPVSALGNAPPYLPLGSPHPRPALPATPPPPSLQRGS